MILVDASIIMYAAGAEHPHKRPSVALLERIADGELEATIDAEVLQEILHRYRAIGRWEDGRQVYDLTRQLFPSVVPVTAAVLDRARRVLDDDSHIMARDALHAAVVMTEGLEAVCSYDHDFDRIKGLVRREPHEL
ncbi:MAG TPA: type II toxin-antitoxin system VapC family toxin [Gemmatimonadales bacterium]|nr:type II toxin-antitoxin system VapC family toxin [Gemmatimonadales bacterium]